MCPLWWRRAPAWSIDCGRSGRSSGQQPRGCRDGPSKMSPCTCSTTIAAPVTPDRDGETADHLRARTASAVARLPSEMLDCARCDQGERLPVTGAKITKRDGVAVVLEVPMDQYPHHDGRSLAWSVAGASKTCSSAVLAGTSKSPRATSRSNSAGNVFGKATSTPWARDPHKHRQPDPLPDRSSTSEEHQLSM